MKKPIFPYLQVNYINPCAIDEPKPIPKKDVPEPFKRIIDAHQTNSSDPILGPIPKVHKAG